jgi:acylphosphatase
MAGNARAEALYSGYVQGVGFRYTARQTASRFDVTGFVQNLSNGQVRVVSEGTRPEVEEFLKAVQEEMGEYIESADVSWSPATGEFTNFTVRF